MASVERVRVIPRRVTNAVGAGHVQGPERRPELPLAVIASISWDGGRQEEVEGQCLAWTAEYALVQVRDKTTSLSFKVWLEPRDVRTPALY